LKFKKQFIIILKKYFFIEIINILFINKKIYIAIIQKYIIFLLIKKKLNYNFYLKFKKKNLIIISNKLFIFSNKIEINILFQNNIFEIIFYNFVIMKNNKIFNFKLIYKIKKKIIN
jgi:hypothetical protein